MNKKMIPIVGALLCVVLLGGCNVATGTINSAPHNGNVLLSATKDDIAKVEPSLTRAHASPEQYYVESESVKIDGVSFDNGGVEGVGYSFDADGHIISMTYQKTGDANTPVEAYDSTESTDIIPSGYVPQNPVDYTSDYNTLTAYFNGIYGTPKVDNSTRDTEPTVGAFDIREGYFWDFTTSTGDKFKITLVNSTNIGTRSNYLTVYLTRVTT